MYPDTVLEWFVGTAIVLFLMIMMTLIAYNVGHWLDRRAARKKDDDDGAPR